MKTKKLISALVMMLCISHLATAQGTFQKTYGGTNFESGSCMQITSDGGFIIVGETSSYGAGNSDVYILSTDANGGVLWTRTYGGSGNEYGYAVQQTSDGGYIITGSTDSYGAGGYDMFLIKTTADGDTLWSKTYGGAFTDVGLDVKQTTDGGYIVVGNTSGFVSTYLVRTTATGDTLWTKTYGGADYQNSNSVEQTADGGFIIGGYGSGLGGPNSDNFLIRTTSTGDTLWTKFYRSQGDNSEPRVHTTSDGGFIISTNSYNMITNFDEMHLIKANANGDTLWTKAYIGTDQNHCYSSRQAADGGYILAGETKDIAASEYDFFMIKTTANGDTVWTRTFGGVNSEWANSINQTSVGGYILAGGTESFGACSSDIYLIKTDASGNSGCNLGGEAFVVSKPAIQVLTGAIFTVAHSATMVNHMPVILSGGGIESTFCFTDGINEPPTANSFSLFPNPTTSNFTVALSSGFSEDANLQVFNTLGALIYEQTSNQASTLINLNVPSGIYFVKVSDSVNMYTRKLIIL